MKRFMLIFFISLFISLNMLIMPSAAETKALKEGFYTMSDLNLSLNITHTMQNTSPAEYAFVIVFDSNQLLRQFIRLAPQSEKYILVPIETGFQLIVIGNGEVTIS